MQKTPTKVYCILNLQFYGAVLLVVHRVKVRVKRLVTTLYLKYNCVDSTFLTCTKSLREYCLQLQSWITTVHALDFDAENRFCDICMFDFSFCCFNALFALCLDEMASLNFNCELSWKGSYNHLHKCVSSPAIL